VNVIPRLIESAGRSRNPLLRVGYRAIKALGALRRFVANPRIRSQVITRIIYKDQQFQAETASQEDRYPVLFAECQKRLARLPSPRILCFGCSTGEEVFTLAQYLPHAEIIGVDINHWCLKQCAKRNRNNRLRFLHCNSPEFAQTGGFDAIFCMAVFQRTDHRAHRLMPFQTGFTFDRFEAEVRMLDQKLRPGGLFFLDESDYSFKLTEVASRYTALEFPGNNVLRERPAFDRESRLVAEKSIFTRAFVKNSAV